MKVLQVIPAYLPSTHYGGGPGVASALSRELVARGHEVTVLTTDALDESRRVPVRRDELDGARVHYVPNLSNPLAYRQKLFLSPGLLDALDEPLEAHDVVHLHDTRTVQNVVVSRAARRAGVPYVLQAHGALNTAAKAGAKRLFDRAFGTRIVQGAARCLALNEAEAQAFATFGVPPARIEVLPNGIDQASAEAPVGEPGRFRTHLGIDDETFLCLYLGRIHASKSIELLLDAYAEARRDQPDVDAALVLVGPDDGARAGLEQRARELGIDGETRFAGFVDEATRDAAYRDADVAVVPSFFGFPLVILEAWSAGTPVLVTTKHERLGFLDGAGQETEPNPAALGRALSRYLGERALAASQGRAGRALVLERFTWPRIADRLVEVYEGVARTAPGARR